VIASLTTNYFPAGTLNPGTIRAALLGCFLFYFLFDKFNITLINNLILGFLIYLLILVLISSNVSRGLYVYSQLLMTFLMFPVGYHYFYSKDRFMKLHKVFAVCLTLFVINIFIANIFKLGTSDYLDDTLYFGAGRVNITKTMTILLLISPIGIQIFSKKPWMKIYGFIILVSVIIIILGLKRSAVIALLIGFLVFVVFSPQKRTVVRLLLIFFLFIYVSSFYFLDTFYQRLEARGQRVELFSDNFIETEGRFNEFDLIFDDFGNRTIWQKIFGTEIFNELMYFDIKRTLHTDYMILLHGTGFFGLMLYFLIWFYIIKKNFLIGRRGDETLIKYNNVIIFSLFIAMLFISFAGSLYSMGLRSILMLYLGAATKYNMVSLYYNNADLPIKQ
jgi:hypothetical protein